MDFLLAIVLAIVLALAAALVAALAVAGVGRRAPAGRPARGGAAGIQWDGPVACYPAKMVAAARAAVRGVIRDSRRFGPATAEDRRRLAAEAARLSGEHGVPMSTEQLVGLRSMELAELAQTGPVRARAEGPKLLAASRGGESVIAIAERLRLPPMAVLRQILAEEGLGAAALADPTQMPARLAREAEAASEADLGSRLNSMRARDRSQAYEDALGRHLRGLGLQFQTEDDLRRAHAASGGQGPLLTPDYLLSEPAHINGRAVHWIDAKDYPMYGGRLMARGLAKQAAKYTDAFGPGAMVFSGGVMCDARVLPEGAAAEPPLLLDGSHVAAEPRAAEPRAEKKGRIAAANPAPPSSGSTFASAAPSHWPRGPPMRGPTPSSRGHSRARSR